MRRKKKESKFNKINITLFDCQVDLILKALTVYSYDTNEKYKFLWLYIRKLHYSN